MPKAVVVGAGIAGLAVAVRLRVKGYDVIVYEANAYPGGKLSEISKDGFRFDAGPSLLTMPAYIDELFMLAGKDPKEYFSYRKLENVCKYFYEDGTQLHAWADKHRFADELAANTQDSSEAVTNYLHRSAEIYDITNHIFLEKSLHKISSYLNVKTLNSILRFGKIDPLRTMNQANKARFRDSKTIRFFNRYATYNGSDPYQAPATLNVIPHLEHHYGAYFPLNGMYSIVTGLARLAAELGISIKYNQAVDEISIRNKKAAGISADGLFIPADVVISNMDVWFTYRKLLKSQKAPERILSQERSSSALIFYWGINRRFAALDLHNIFFSENYEEEFKHIWQLRSVYYDPTVYLNISSKLKPDDAPPGCENWFVMINVPADSGQDWAELIAGARKNIVSKLSRMLALDVSSLIVSETVLSPQGIEQKTASYQGSLYGTSSNGRLAAFLRHPNYSSGIGGLYFAGGSVHPGGGIPLALLSARIVAGLIR